MLLSLLVGSLKGGEGGGGGEEGGKGRGGEGGKGGKGSRGGLPGELVRVMRMVSRLVREKFGEASEQTFLCGFFFLRFVCPAIATPFLFGIKVSPFLSKVKYLLSICISRELDPT